MNKFMILVTIFIICCIYGATCDNVEEGRQFGTRIRSRQRYQYNHPPLSEYDEKIPVAVVYDKVIDRTSRRQKTVKSVTETEPKVSFLEDTKVAEPNILKTETEEVSTTEQHDDQKNGFKEKQITATTPENADDDGIISIDDIKATIPTKLKLELKIPVSVVYDDVTKVNKVRPGVHTVLRKPLEKEETSGAELNEGTNSPVHPSNYIISDKFNATPANSIFEGTSLNKNQINKIIKKIVRVRNSRRRLQTENSELNTPEVQFENFGQEMLNTKETSNSQVNTANQNKPGDLIPKTTDSYIIADNDNNKSSIKSIRKNYETSLTKPTQVQNPTKIRSRGHIRYSTYANQNKNDDIKPFSSRPSESSIANPSQVEKSNIDKNRLRAHTVNSRRRNQTKNDETSNPRVYTKTIAQVTPGQVTETVARTSKIATENYNQEKPRPQSQNFKLEDTYSNIPIENKNQVISEQNSPTKNITQETSTPGLKTGTRSSNVSTENYSQEKHGQWNPILTSEKSYPNIPNENSNQEKSRQIVTTKNSNTKLDLTSEKSYLNILNESKNQEKSSQIVTTNTSNTKLFTDKNTTQETSTQVTNTNNSSFNVPNKNYDQEKPSQQKPDINTEKSFLNTRTETTNQEKTRKTTESSDPKVLSENDTSKQRVNNQLNFTVPIIASENRVYGNTGEFRYSYESADGTRAFEKGNLRIFDKEVAGEAVEGGFSYTDKDGTDFSLSYTADEKGYRPTGAHLPTPPPIPPAIARALAYLATKPTPEPVTEVTTYE